MEFQKFMPEGWFEESENIVKDNIKEFESSGKVIQGLVKECDCNCNLHVKFGNNIEGIIPRKEVEALELDENGNVDIKSCERKVNKYIQFKVKSVEDDKIILSRKDATLDAINWFKQDVKEGMILNGIVKNIRQFGAFVEIGAGVVGLLHIEDMSVSRIKTPKDRFYIGQKINVMVKSIDKETGRIVLTHKELLGTWEENIKDFKEGTRVEGTVREVEKFKNGIFIELKPNLVGMAEYKENVNYGEKVTVYIKKIIKEKKKVKLLIVGNN